MQLSIWKGLGFGLTSGIITTLGLMVGLNSGTHSEKIVIGGILIIAVADALSDALGIHVSEESDSNKTTRQIWMSTLATFLSKLIIASTFIVPILVFELSTAIIVSIAWGLSLIALFSYYVAKHHHEKPTHVVMEHIIIAIVVIIITNYIGKLINILF
jgi:VIT1/CCC1 family predicted Fe2+/Mn2+ transporter